MPPIYPRLAGFSLLASTGAVLLAGLLLLDGSLTERWCWSGSWTYPVGDPFDYNLPSADGTDGYRANRRIRKEPRAHQGVDLSNQDAGGAVRAAAHGLVVAGGLGQWSRGYGWHLVLAHRLDDGALVYSVYAHLQSGSVHYGPGDLVGAGSQLGRVGMTGRASAPHLHFEVRRPASTTERWEHAAIVDPLEFIRARLPSQRTDSTWARDYLMWAEQAGALAPGARGEATLTRGEWWRMLAAGYRQPFSALSCAPESLGTWLEAATVLQSRRGRAEDRTSWKQVRNDLERARGLGLRLPPGPLETRLAQGRRGVRLGLDRAAIDLDDLVRRDQPPTLALACLVLAGAAGDTSSSKRVAGTPDR